MYHWLVYIHVLATFAFLLTHGVSSVVALRLRRQRDPAVARAWLELNTSGSMVAALYGTLLTLCSQWHRQRLPGRLVGPGLDLALPGPAHRHHRVHVPHRFPPLQPRASGVGHGLVDGRKEHPPGEPAPAEDSRRYWRKRRRLLWRLSASAASA